MFPRLVRGVYETRLDIYKNKMAISLDTLNNSMDYFLGQYLRLSAENKNELFGIDMSIESLRSQEFSVAIFFFLVVSLIFFAFIIWLYLPKDKKKMRIGEKIMFGSLIAGIFIAIGMGYLQLIEGFLL